MIEWREQGILLAVRRHGEANAIIEVLTRDHGLHAGVVRGGASRKQAPLLQVGAQLDLTWRARIEDHIGSFVVEPVRSRAVPIMADRAALAALQSVAALLTTCIAERQPVEEVHDRTYALLDTLARQPDWPQLYAQWELSLLADLGFGLDLSCCAVTGVTQQLRYVSPRTGRAVSQQGAGEWADRLLPLPLFLLMGGDASAQETADALRLTGHFLRQWLGPTLTRSNALDARDQAARAIVGQMVKAAGTPTG
ncbi:DNA replication and repair protein RecO [Monaibacterium marinum]|uniref:DNA repair protein RecO n=1 Tax=Pontivivens marinum TaxID=1690039 RepID=A0A2C9CMN3_9RHOB|nr:DNA replication and repair protein RecO [Monaibacterium marinum]